MKHILKSGEQFIVDGYTSEGEHKVLNLLDTNTDDIATLKVVSHTKLQYLKNTEQLSPGTFYRIIDYKCTSTQQNTQVGQGQFDLVVQALSESELSEKGRCIRHSGDSYFSNCKVESWEVNYSLDNNKSKYSWVDDEVIAICCDDGDDVNPWYKRRPELDESKNGTQYYAWNRIWNSEEDDYWMLMDVDKNDTFNLDSENNYQSSRIYTRVNNPEQGQSIQQYYKSGSNFYLDGNYSYHIIQKGHGVIYWMKDEFGNECPYDFKHLKFFDSGKGDYAWTFNETAESIDLSTLPTKEIVNAKIWTDSFWNDEGNGPEWAPDYTMQELQSDYTIADNGGNTHIFEYTGNSIEYDGETLYIWRYSAESTDEYAAGSGKNYAFTTSLDYSNVDISDQINIYALGHSEDTADFYTEFGDNDIQGEIIYHGTYSTAEIPDLSSIIDDFSSVSAEINIDSFVDEDGNWTIEGYDGPEDLVNAAEDPVGYYEFTGECVQYDGKQLFFWRNTDIDRSLFTTGLNYSGYTAVDQICPVYAFGTPEGGIIYDQDNDSSRQKSMRSIIVTASYSGPSIPKGNLSSLSGDLEISISQNLSETIQYNIIPIKYNESGVQVLDTTQIYYGSKRGYPYTKEEIDEAHKVIALALNDQKNELDHKIPFSDIIEVEHVRTIASIIVDSTTYYRKSEDDLESGNYPYCWEENEEQSQVYTELETPAAGDNTYDSEGTALNDTVESFIPANDGSIITQEIDPWKYYVFGEVNSLEVSLSEEVSTYTPIYRFLFTAASSSTQLILPQDCSLASGHSLVMAEGKSYEITVINNIVRVVSATLE